MARSSSSMEPMASAPSAMAGCTPMAKRHGQGLRRSDSAMRWNSQRCLPSVRWMDVRVAPLDHQAVVGAVPVLARGVLGEGDGGGDVRARVPLVMEDLGQVVEIDALPGEDHVLAGAGLHDLRRDRLVHGPEIRREHLDGAAPMARARRERLAWRLVSTGNFVPRIRSQIEHGPPPRFALELDHERGQLVGRIHLPGDGDDLLGPGCA